MLNDRMINIQILCVIEIELYINIRKIFFNFIYFIKYINNLNVIYKFII